MPHQKLLILMIRIGLIATITTLGWNFPLKEVAQPDCRGTDRASLDEKCKIDIIAGSHKKDIGQLFFSALRGTSYEKPTTAKSGGHPSLDLPSSAGTPVYAIHDGEVINASERNGYGLSITIKHTFNNQTIYSNYSHLSEILVKKGDRVTGNMVIGKIGCTGYSVSGDPTRCGNHLDFQITTAKSPSHPYGYGDCKEGDYFDAVEKGLCAEKLRAYTIDPLQFFAENTNIDINYPLIAPYIKTTTQEHHSAPVETKTPTTTTQPKTSLQSIFARLRAQNSAILGKGTVTPTGPANTQKTETFNANTQLGTLTQLQQSDRSASIDDGTIRRSWNADLTTLSSYKVVTLTITVADSFGNSFIGTLAKPLKVTIDNTLLGSFFPDQFTMLHTDKKHLFFQTRQPGTATISLWYGDKKIGEEKVEVK